MSDFGRDVEAICVRGADFDERYMVGLNHVLCEPTICRYTARTRKRVHILIAHIQKWSSVHSIGCLDDRVASHNNLLRTFVSFSSQDGEMACMMEG